MIERLTPGISARHARVALFDFDGTISLIRSGWMDVMVPMMVEILSATGTRETEAELKTVVEDFVWRLTGKQTIYQTIALAEQVAARGGTPLDPLVYKKMYLDRLHERIRYRLEELESGAVSPDRYLVPGARALLESLASRGLRMFLASGTDQEYMRHEADLLDVSRYFDGGVYGALDDYKAFSKKILVQRLIASAETKGRRVPVFRRRLRRNRKRQRGGRCRRRRGHLRAGLPHRGRVEAQATGGRGGRFHCPQLSRPGRVERGTVSGWPVGGGHDDSRSSGGLSQALRPGDRRHLPGPLVHVRSDHR